MAKKATKKKAKKQPSKSKPASSGRRSTGDAADALGASMKASFRSNFLRKSR